MTSAQRKMDATIAWAQKSEAVINSLAKSFSVDRFNIKLMLHDSDFRQKILLSDTDYIALYNEIVRLKEGPKRERRIDKIDNPSH